MFAMYVAISADAMIMAASCALSEDHGGRHAGRASGAADVRAAVARASLVASVVVWCRVVRSGVSAVQPRSPPRAWRPVATHALAGDRGGSLWRLRLSWRLNGVWCLSLRVCGVQHARAADA